MGKQDFRINVEFGENTDFGLKNTILRVNSDSDPILVKYRLWESLEKYPFFGKMPILEKYRCSWPLCFLVENGHKLPDNGQIVPETAKSPEPPAVAGDQKSTGAAAPQSYLALTKLGMGKKSEENNNKSPKESKKNGEKSSTNGKQKKSMADTLKGFTKM